MALACTVRSPAGCLAGNLGCCCGLSDAPQMLVRVVGSHAHPIPIVTLAGLRIAASKSESELGPSGSMPVKLAS